jgi:PAS domain-containing protein
LLAAIAVFACLSHASEISAGLERLPQYVPGLVVYDGSERIVIHNRRFLEIYGLSPDEVKPGTFLIDVLKRRRDKFNLAAIPEAYRNSLIKALAAGRPPCRPATPDRGA